MKIRTIILGCLVSAAVLLVGYPPGTDSHAQPKTDKSSSKTGVVSVRKVFRDSKRNSKYRADVMAEQTKVRAEMEKLSKEIEAQEAGLKTLKRGSVDYLAQYKELLAKRANLDVQQQVINQERSAKDQRWMEELYSQILQITTELAKQKGLELVLEADEPEFPVESADELMMTLSTHKVLYTAGCLDLTSEVVARLDAKEELK
jgi:Skp family chaperone for outer membrane proteins